MPESGRLPRQLVQELLDGSAQIRRYVRRNTADPGDAADVYQESVTRVLEQARARRIDNPVAYAIRTARNLMSRRVREEPLDQHEPVCSGPSPEDSYSYNQRVERLSAALKAMPSLRREVFIRRRIHGESREEIARALNLSREAVKKHMTRALVDIQRHLDRQQRDQQTV
ncbi:RNA polymerase sigma factor [Microbulbifer halophilus]|uniref:RNA polymerase sigma factor n=1 Tax=Microbulbifer halophilus TaxID=453963 RepID=A0ABW5EFJ4_9GAMM|nr:sigma-70 family RNA polymerase sigma factor [Microbulbifer halophilus]MCW8126464.1 sigma-70 family RNA polymerase sigma factor [Microbulbifer halophilus]